MSRENLILMCIVHMICCVIGGIVNYFIFKNSLRGKLTNLLLFLIGVTVYSSALMFYEGISIPRILIAATIQGLAGHITMTLFLVHVIRPVNTINACLDAMSTGDFTQKPEYRGKDEIGAIFTKLHVMMAELSTLVESIKTNANENLQMVENLNAISSEMAGLAGVTTEKTETSAAKAEHMRSDVTKAAASMKEIAGNTEVVADALEAMTSTINEIAENSDKANRITHDAVIQAKNTSGKVQELGKAARDISKVTETITKISEQTNLLALNATIEAARAGESGKGFAVVAGEIKELARQTAKATHEIKSMIEGVQRTASGTVEEIGQITKVIDDGNEIVSTIAAAVEEQSITTREIAGNVQHVSKGIQDVSGTVFSSQMAFEEIAAVISRATLHAGQMSEKSAHVNAVAGTLSGLAVRLQEKAGKFKTLKAST